MAQPMPSTSTNGTSYANKVRNNHNNTQIIYPKRNQAITMNTHDNITIREYLRALGQLINPQKVHAASRISNNRICIYLTDTETVDKLVQEHKYLTISNKNIEIRRLVAPTIKIIISNCSPSIPNPIIEEKLNELGIKLASPIRFLRIGIQEDMPEFNHVLSFRRQVYIIEEENTFIPDSIFVEHEDRPCKLFLMEDKLQCTICHRHGHTEQQCYQKKSQEPQQPQENQPAQAQPEKHDEIEPTQNIQQTQPEQAEQTINTQPLLSEQAETQILPLKNSTKKMNNIITNYFLQQEYPTQTQSTQKSTTQHQEQPTTTINTDSTEKTAQATENSSEDTLTTLEITQEDADNIRHLLSKIPNIPTPIKRPALNTSSSEENIKVDTPSIKTNQKTKKQKTNNTNDTEEQLAEIKLEIENNPEKYCLDYETFKDLIENAQGNRDKISLANDYTQDLTKLCTMLQSLYPLLQDSKMKNRFTRLINKINISNNSQNDNSVMES